jgi:hypothetical protein
MSINMDTQRIIVLYQPVLRLISKIVSYHNRKCKKTIYSGVDKRRNCPNRYKN